MRNPGIVRGGTLSGAGRARIILASASPRRAELLREAGIPFVTRAARVKELALPGELPERTAERLALLKARDVFRRSRAPGGRRLVLGADTVVAVGRRCLGKPSGHEEAARMLASLSGRSHRVITGVAICGPGRRGPISGRCVTRVTFRRLSAREIDRYVATGEPLDKAGAYGIQAGAAGFVTRVKGSYSNVVGLPMHLVRRLLGEATRGYTAASGGGRRRPHRGVRRAYGAARS